MTTITDPTGYRHPLEGCPNCQHEIWLLAHDTVEAKYLYECINCFGNFVAGWDVFWIDNFEDTPAPEISNVPYPEYVLDGFDNFGEWVLYGN